jgi:hypothetical protein
MAYRLKGSDLLLLEIVLAQIELSVIYSQATGGSIGST